MPQLSHMIEFTAPVASGVVRVSPKLALFILNPLLPGLTLPCKRDEPTSLVYPLLVPPCLVSVATLPDLC
jgi:hypothetical protein